MTPRELWLVVDAYNAAHKRRRDEMLTQAHLTAHWQRAKKMPSLKKVLEEKKTNPAKAKTPEQMLAFAMNLQRAFEREEG